MRSGTVGMCCGGEEKPQGICGARGRVVVESEGSSLGGGKRAEKWVKGSPAGERWETPGGGSTGCGKQAAVGPG